MSEGRLTQEADRFWWVRALGFILVMALIVVLGKLDVWTDVAHGFDWLTTP